MPCMERYVKHARLIKAVYPAAPEIAPNSNELSYLVFYASSRPEKLTKVGAYLEKRATKDIWYRRKIENQVTLQILDALMNACNKDLNLFSKSIVKIISAMIETKDIDLMSQASHSFVKFCRFHNGSTLGVDADFTASYEELVGRFCRLSVAESDDAELNGMHRLIGLRAVLGVVSSEALYASESANQMTALLSAILSNLINPSGNRSGSRISLKSSTNMLSEQRASNQSIDASSEFLSRGKRYSISANATPAVDPSVVKSASADVAGAGAVTTAKPPIPSSKHSCPSVDDLNTMSLHTLRKLTRNCNGSNVKLLLAAVFSFFDQSNKWIPKDYSVSLMKAIASAMHQQNRHLIVSNLLNILDDPNTATSETNGMEKQATVVSIIAAQLTCRLPFSGMSVVELLNDLFDHLLKTLKEPYDAKNAFNANSNKDLTPLGKIRSGLIEAIGGLASNIYYSNQVIDVAVHLISKLGTTANIQDAAQIANFQKAILLCVQQIFTVNFDEIAASARKKGALKSNDALNSDRRSGERADISLDILAPSAKLLVDRNQDVRLMYTSVVLTCLQKSKDRAFPASLPFALDESSETAESLEELEPNVQPPPSTPSQVPERRSKNQFNVFRAAIHRSLFDLANSPYTSPADYRSLLALFDALLARFGDSELSKSIPILFKIQNLHRDLDDPAKQRAAMSLLVEVLILAANMYEIGDLRTYAEKVRSYRLEHSQYSPIFFFPASDAGPSERRKLGDAHLGIATLDLLESAMPPSSSSEYGLPSSAPEVQGAANPPTRYAAVAGPPHVEAIEVSDILSHDVRFSTQDMGKRVLRDYVPGEYPISGQDLPSMSGGSACLKNDISDKDAKNQSSTRSSNRGSDFGFDTLERHLDNSNSNNDSSQTRRSVFGAGGTHVGAVGDQVSHRIRTSRDLDALRVRPKHVGDVEGTIPEIRIDGEAAKDSGSSIKGKAAESSEFGNNNVPEEKMNVEDLRDAFLAAEIGYGGYDDEIEDDDDGNSLMDAEGRDYRGETASAGGRSTNFAADRGVASVNGEAGSATSTAIAATQADGNTVRYSALLPENDGDSFVSRSDKQSAKPPRVDLTDILRSMVPKPPVTVAQDSPAGSQERIGSEAANHPKALSNATANTSESPGAANQPLLKGSRSTNALNMIAALGTSSVKSSSPLIQPPYRA